MEVTLAIIKPDALEAGYKRDILHTIKRYKFTVLNSGRVKFTRLRAEEFYDDHVKTAPYFNDMIDYMMRRPVFVMALARENCVRAFRNLMGPKDATKARETHPHSLRALYGRHGRCNGIHGSDSAESARREIKFFFPSMILEPYPTKPLAEQYFNENIQPVLIKGLTILAKLKPSSDPIAVCRWLARWLHDNNPKLPKLSPDVIPDSQLLPVDFVPPAVEKTPPPVFTHFAPSEYVIEDPYARR